ncbi:MAG: hypothetical protein M1813_007254 [Trichoglossum hirsutum]|nr:MAG: hypothetical protein M1813_007254 [Trichoglossum hirsutum]
MLPAIFLAVASFLVMSSTAADPATTTAPPITGTAPVSCHGSPAPPGMGSGNLFTIVVIDLPDASVPTICSQATDQIKSQAEAFPDKSSKMTVNNISCSTKTRGGDVATNFLHMDVRLDKFSPQAQISVLTAAFKNAVGNPNLVFGPCNYES